MTKQQEYLDLQKRHRKEFEEFPIEEALEKLGATKMGVDIDLPVVYFRKNREGEDGDQND